jgi:hypothetical protein
VFADGNQPRRLSAVLSSLPRQKEKVPEHFTEAIVGELEIERWSSMQRNFEFWIWAR